MFLFALNSLNLVMAKKYFSYFLLIILHSFLWFNSTHAQELKIFTLNDFDLKGNVKSCIVITNYGKEEFEFNEDGLLTKSVTRFSDTDYEKTYYKYVKGELSEKRLENYRDGKFDKSTSIANIYTLDTTAGKQVTEKIISYTKEFIDQYEYLYDEEGNLKQIKRANNSGIDNTKLVYTNYKGESTTSYFLNEILQKSVRTSIKQPNFKVVLTKEFMDGQPVKALEHIYNDKEQIISEIHFVYNKELEEFKPSKNIRYEYNEMEMLSGVITQSEAGEDIIKNYVYQYDNGNKGNWIKKIITPDNTYTTRKITYYTLPEVADKEKP